MTVVPLLGAQVDKGVAIVDLPRAHDVRDAECWLERQTICEWAASEGIAIVMIDPVAAKRWSVGVVGDAGAVAVRLRWS